MSKQTPEEIAARLERYFGEHRDCEEPAILESDFAQECCNELIPALLELLRARDAEAEHLIIALRSLADARDAALIEAERDKAELQKQLDDDSPGTPLGRIKGLCEYAEQKLGLSTVSSRGPEGVILNALEQAQADQAELAKVCQTSRDLLQPVLVEPGRTVFWMMVDALAKHGGERS